VAKDKVLCVWFSANGERLGTYQGHQGAIWTVDVSPNTVLVATGAADNTVILWNVKTGESVKVWEFPTAVKRVEFSPDGNKLLAVTEKRMGYLGTIVVFDINYGDGEGEGLDDQTDEPSLKITCEESKATVAGWSYLSKYIIAGHEDGSVSQYDAKVSSDIAKLYCIPVQTANLRADRQVNNWKMSKHMNLNTKSMIFNFPLTARPLSPLQKTRLQRYSTPGPLPPQRGYEIADERLRSYRPVT
jgi:WD40 repeat protein